ncbi:hypothetical protein DM02DRAFT_141732 [Periconia macrospinosa]|uniref:Uncharacterized protein n=1 Tax=Periconia macrospinosa TaxID=97972 RepID=A0A2V1DCB2_9PLEO|nr:hypothetical protein DM02DRAFT_141732 [Periconia macrospinosa]
MSSPARRRQFSCVPAAAGIAAGVKLHCATNLKHGRNVAWCGIGAKPASSSLKHFMAKHVPFPICNLCSRCKLLICRDSCDAATTPVTFELSSGSAFNLLSFYLCVVVD